MKFSTRKQEENIKKIGVTSKYHVYHEICQYNVRKTCVLD